MTAYPHNKSDGNARSDRSLLRLVIKSGEWLLPLMCVYLISASVVYAINTAAHDVTNTTAMDGSTGTRSITRPPDPRDDPLRGNFQVPTQDSLPLEMGPGGFPQTASVR